MAHEMQRDGERARLEGTIPLWRTEHTGVSSAPFRERRRDRFREGKQRLALSGETTLEAESHIRSHLYKVNFPEGQKRGC